MFQIRTFEELTDMAGGPTAGNGGGVGSELVVSIAISICLFNVWTRLARRLDSEFCALGTKAKRGKGQGKPPAHRGRWRFISSGTLSLSRRRTEVRRQKEKGRIRQTTKSPAKI